MQHDSTTTPAGNPEPADPDTAAAQSTPASEAAPADPAEQLRAEVEKLKGQIADLTDRLLRAHAEMDNLRKRAEREKADTAKYAITKFANDIANVADNFDRAIQSVPASAVTDNAALKSLLDGVTMTEREFLNALERHGVKRIDPKGEPFNPHYHQAVMEMQNTEVAAGTVLQVYQAGYLIEDRVLRPAMVVVAKGGYKPVKSPEPASEAAKGPAAPADAKPDADPSKDGAHESNAAGDGTA